MVSSYGENLQAAHVELGMRAAFSHWVYSLNHPFRHKLAGPWETRPPGCCVLVSSLWTLLVPCHVPSCLSVVPSLGQERHCRPFCVESAQWSSPGEGLRSSKFPVEEDQAVLKQMSCPFSGMGSGRKRDVLWPPGGAEGTAGEVKHSSPPSFFPGTSQSLSLRLLVSS